MYTPKSFAVSDQGLVDRFIRSHPLSTICVWDGNGLSADHVPLRLQSPLSLSGNHPHASLDGHIARANPLFHKAADGIDCLAIFQSGGGYISPNHYATKRTHGRVVPTWNYQAVHCYGRLSIINDPQWIATLVNDLTADYEQSQPIPWMVSDAPKDYMDAMLQAIVGISIRVDRIEAKFKMSQNQPQENIDSLINALAQGNDDAQRLGEAIRDANR